MRWRAARGFRALALASAIAGACAMPARASAQPKDPGEAERLFKEGRAEYEAKHYARACELLASSDALEPAVGTLGLLAACHEQSGKLAKAYTEYLDVAKRAHDRNDSRETVARTRAAQLAAKIGKLTAVTQGSARSVTVTCDTAPIPLETEVPLDPGDHRLAASTGGREAWATTVTIRPNTTVTVTIPVSDTAATPAPPAGAGEPASPTPREEAAPSNDGNSTRRTLGFVVGGVGVAALAGAVVTGALYLGDKSTLADPNHCDEQKRCDADGLSARDAIRTLGPLNAVLWGVAVVGLGAGAVLIVTSRSSAPRAAIGVDVGPTRAEVTLRRAF